MDEEDLKKMVVEYFKKLFEEEASVNATLPNTSNFPCVEGCKADLASIPSNQEIHDTLKLMGLYKAPGVDGFHPIFFHKN